MKQSHWTAGIILCLLILVPFGLQNAGRLNSVSLAKMDLMSGHWCNAVAQDRLEARMRLADALGQDGQMQSSLTRLSALRNLCTDAAFAQKQEAAQHVAAAAACTQAQNWQCVTDRAAQAIRLVPRSIDAWAILHQAYVQGGLVERAAHAEHSMQELAPQHKLAEYAFTDGWVLTGFDLDTHALEFDGRLDVTLYWRAPSQVDGVSVVRSSDGSSTLYRVGKQGFQEISTPNLVINGGFELTDQVGAHMILGFGDDRYAHGVNGSNLIAAHSTRVTERGHAQSLCAELDNRVTSPTGFVSNETTASPGQLYLLGAQALHAGAGTHVGMLRQRPPEAMRNAYVDPIATSASGWSDYAGLLSIPDGTSSISLQLLNQDVDNTVCFDNAFLLRISTPEGM